jgi:hypothetical protein
MGSDLSKPKLVQMGDNDLLKRQLVKNQLVSPNFARNNNILINLITNVDFLKTICPKNCVVFKASLLLIAI